jgi:hypothetical protein
MCGKKLRVNDGAFISDVTISGDSHLSFIMCSSLCVVEFHNPEIRAFVNGYINDRIRVATEIYNKNKKQ